MKTTVTFFVLNTDGGDLVELLLAHPIVHELDEPIPISVDLDTPEQHGGLRQRGFTYVVGVNGKTSVWARGRLLLGPPPTTVQGPRVGPPRRGFGWGGSTPRVPPRSFLAWLHPGLA